MQSKIKKVLVIGAGTMGEQIASQILKNNFKVNLYDISPKNLETANTNLKNQISIENLNGLISMTELKAAVADIDLVIETIVEDLRVKRKLFKQLNLICEKNVIFTTNTSYLLPSKLAKSTGRSELFCAYHFHAPARGSNVVDIMSHKNTSKDVVNVLEDFTRKIGLMPMIIKKEHSSYIYNDIQNSIMTTSLRLVLKGITDYRDVDKAWMGNTGMKVGPFGILDAIGLETAMHIVKIMAKKNPFLFGSVNYLKKFVKEGKLGIKTGEGFYKYPNPEYLNNDFLNE